MSLRDRLEILIPPLPWDQPRWVDTGGPPVLLLHGLWRGFRAMEPMARALRKEGFSTLNLTYPSSRKSIPDLLEYIREVVEPITQDQPIHLVTHSLGGIIARTALMEAKLKIHRVVMLAPPNQGSEIVDFFEQNPLLHQLLGPAGKTLGRNGTPTQLPPIPEHTDTAVIMGKTDSIKIFKRLMEAPNDGIVTVSGGKIPGINEFAVIDADHTFIPMHPEAVRLSSEFLKSGRWSARN